MVVTPATAAINAVGGQIVPNDPESLDYFYNVDPSTQQDNSGISLQFDKEFDTFDFTSITSFRSLDTQFLIDTDFTSADLASNGSDQ